MNQIYTVPEYPGKIQIGILDGYCNLKCPMCFLHSPDSDIDKKKHRGEMAYDDFCRILDEVKDHGPAISPYRWSEPLLFKHFATYAAAIKERNLATVLNTNGLQLDRDLRRQLIEMEFDSITISHDTLSRDIYKQIRGVDCLEKVQKITRDFLSERKEAGLPRIGVSMTVNRYNRHERDAFVDFWLEHVDVIRVSKTIEKDFSIRGVDMEDQRSPCSSLYDSMVIDFKGDVVLCCMDALGKTNMGNVFRDGVKGVWHNEKFTRARHLHETGQYGKLPLCKRCANWTNINFKETLDRDRNRLIRESPVMTFYNRLDRLESWNRQA